MKNLRTFLPAIVSAAATVCFAQPNRVLSKIDTAQEVILAGHVHPLASAANDAGAVEGEFPAALHHPDAQAYRRPAVQPATVAAGPAESRVRQLSSMVDAGTVRRPLRRQLERCGADRRLVQAQGFTVDPVSRSRTFITFGGTAAQVQASFGTAIHHYRVNGSTHYANSTDPGSPRLCSPGGRFPGIARFPPQIAAW